MEELTSIEIQQEADASKINENENTEYTQCRIYEVPFHLREQNEKAYTPQVISIGLIHRDKEKLKTMRKHKERYFKGFMQRNVVVNEKDLENFVQGFEGRVRHSYVPTIDLYSPWVYMEMIVVDAIFILELFLRCHEGSWEIDDPMKVEAWLLNIVWLELLLLENQCPFSVINKIYDFALPSCSKSTPLIQLTFEFFKSLNIHKKSHTNVEIQEIQHFTDLLRFFQLPNKLPERVKEVTFPKYSVTQLHDAGVRFEVISSRCVFDLSFKNGVLEIPLLEFQDDTEARILNIMALEQCDYRRPKFITDFYLILGHLINTTKDLDLLSDRGIVINGLGDNNAVTSMIHNLSRGIFLGDMNCNFNRLSIDLNEYYEQPRHRWKALLRQQYLNMAILLLVLTLIQTVLSILQVVL